MPRRAARAASYAGLDLTSLEASAIVPRDVRRLTAHHQDLRFAHPAGEVTGESLRAAMLPAFDRVATAQRPDPLTVADYARLYPSPSAALPAVRQWPEWSSESVAVDPYTHVEAREMVTELLLAEAGDLEGFRRDFDRRLRRKFGEALAAALSAIGPCLVGTIRTTESQNDMQDVRTFTMSTRLLPIPPAPASGADVPVTLPADF